MPGPIPAHPRPTRRAVILAALAAVAVVLVAGTTPASAAGSSPRDRLRAAAHGTLAGGFGTLQFQRGGRARFAVKECGFQPVRPGFVTTFTDCSPEAAAGTVTATDHGYELRRANGSTIRFSAYVDGLSQVHLGFGTVARLSAARTGTVNVSPSERLVITASGCRYVAAGVTHPSACQFIPDAGRTVLTYTAPNPAAAGTTLTAGLVYLPDLRLIVSPDMVDRVYPRV